MGQLTRLKGWEIKLVIDFDALDQRQTLPFGLVIKPLPDGKPYGNTGTISIEIANQIKDDDNYLKVMLGTLKANYPKEAVKKESIRERLKRNERR